MISFFTHIQLILDLTKVDKTRLLRVYVAIKIRQLYDIIYLLVRTMIVIK
jgi:hypothetical protein